jgi:lipid-binding SYLF domain-containing protein
LFFGVSLEASVIACRPEVNRDFYGQDIKPTALLTGQQPRPTAAEPLYKALEEILKVPPPVEGSSDGGRH